MEKSTLLSSDTEFVNYRWLVVLGFNTTLTVKVISWRSVTHVFPGFLTSVLTQHSFQSHRILFSHASAEARGEKAGKKVRLNRPQTHNHQVMCPTRSTLSHLGGFCNLRKLYWKK